MVNDHGTLLDSIKAILDLDPAFGNQPPPRVVDSWNWSDKEPGSRGRFSTPGRARVLADRGKAEQKGAVKERKNQPGDLIPKEKTAQPQR